MNWLLENWSTILQILTGAVTVASLIVKLTPTLKDDSVWLPIVKFLGRYVALDRTVNDNEIRSKVE